MPFLKYSSVLLLCNDIREKVANLAPFLLFRGMFGEDIQEVRCRDTLISVVLVVSRELLKNGVHPLVEIIFQNQRVILPLREGLPREMKQYAGKSRSDRGGTGGSAFRLASIALRLDCLPKDFGIVSAVPRRRVEGPRFLCHSP